MESTKKTPDLSRIKTAFERSKKAVSLKPSLGLGTGISRARIVDGLSCEITEGNWALRADMPESIGGNASGPTPGVYGRAALGSCLAIGYMLRAAALQIPVYSLEVEVKAEYDDGALLGSSDNRPGYLSVHYVVTIESDAPEEVIIRMMDEADSHSPYLDVFSNAQSCVREIKIIATKTIA